MDVVDVEDNRHWRHQFDDNVAPSLHSLARVVSSLLPQIDAHHFKSPSIYNGTCGIAFMYMRLADHDAENRTSYLNKALQLTLQAENKFHPKRITFLEGRAGSLALQIAIYHALNNNAKYHECVAELWTLFSERVHAMPEAECEVLYGRCGYLHAILFLRKRLRQMEFGRDVTSRIIGQVLRSGMMRTREGSSLSYQWHGKEYFGAAHGYAGILYVLSQFPQELQTFGYSLSTLGSLVRSSLRRCQFKSGNIGSSLGNNSDRLVHWCHGAPGWIDTCIAVGCLDLALQLGQVVWIRGLLSRKGPGLCHGIPGNGYTLLSLWRVTNDVKWLYRAQYFAAFTAEHMSDLLRNTDEPYSLHCGAAGAVCIFLDCLNPGKATSIYFDHFG